MTSKNMSWCPALTKKRKKCPNNGHRDDGFLCHIHREMPEHRVAAFVAAQPQSDHMSDVVQQAEALLALVQEVESAKLAYWKEMVRCEAVNRNGEQCSREMRRIWATTDAGPRCKSHGGGRGGMTIEQAISAIG